MKPLPDVVTQPSTEALPTTLCGMLHSSVINDSASYDVWRSSMTALLDMEVEEFEQMLNLTSEKKNPDHDLYEENQALRKENQQLKKTANEHQQTEGLLSSR